MIGYYSTIINLSKNKMEEQQMIRHGHSREFLTSQWLKSDSLEQLKTIEKKVNSALYYAGICTGLAGGHEEGYYSQDYRRNYHSYRQSHHFYKEALKHLGDAYSIADYFAIHFLCNGHESIPHCFMDYLFGCRKKDKEIILSKMQN